MKTLFATVMLLSFSLGFSQTKEIDSLTIQLAFQKQDSSKVDTSILLIKTLYEAHELDRAIKFISETEKLSNTVGYTKGLAEVIHYKGLIYIKKNDYINALNTLKKSQQLYSQLKDTLNIARIYGDLGLLEIRRGNYDEGLVYSLTSIKELEKRTLTAELNKNYRNLAEAYQSIHEYDKAVEYNLKALRIEEQKTTWDNEAIFEIYKNLAILYAYKNENRKAIEYYSKLLDNGIELSREDRASIYPLMGNEYLKLNNLVKARELFNQGLQLNKEIKDSKGVILSLAGLAKINIQTVNALSYRQADAQIQEALTLSSGLDDDEVVLELYKLKMDFDSVRGQYQSAFEWQKKYYELKHKVEVKDQPKSLPTSLSNSKLEIPQIIDEIADTQSKQSSPKDSEFSFTSRYSIILYILLAALIISLVILFSTFSKHNVNSKNIQELEDKNRRLELENVAIKEEATTLEDINKVKDKLFSIVSHDLKDSLTSINGFIDLLKDGSLSRQEFEKLIPELSENASNATLLLFNLLNWSKSQMQSLDPNPSLFDIQEVFEDKVNLIEQRAEAKGISLVDHTLRDFVYADRSMIEIVVQNLLTNAVKFTKAGDTITVSNHISNGNAIISVADTGIGIPKENLDKLFKANTLTTVGTKNEKGTGLGLSICKELVDLNNGKIWVESTVNVGTTFYVQLPKFKPAN